MLLKKMDRVCRYSYCPDSRRCNLNRPTGCSSLCQRILGGRWKAAEANMATDAMSAYFYALDVIGGRWREAEEVIAKDGRVAYKYATEIVKGRFERGEKSMFYFWTFQSRHPVVTPSESISYARVAGKRIPELEKAIIGEAWGSRQVMESRYEYKTHAAIAADYVVAVDVGRIPELEEVIAKEDFESFMYANHLDKPFPRGEEVMLKTRPLFDLRQDDGPQAAHLQADGWGPGAVAAAYEDRFYNGNCPG